MADLKTFASDLHAYVHQHPEWVEWVKQGERLSIKLTEEGAKIIIGDIPVVGGVLVAALTPALDALEKRAEDTATKATGDALDPA